MRASVLALGVGAVGLVGFGLWLGHSSSSAAKSSDTAVVAPKAEPPPPPAVAPAAVPAPTLTRRAPATTRSAPGLAADLVDVDPKVRRAAIREATRAGDADPAVVLAASRDRDLEVGVVATEALGKLYADGAVPLKELVARATDHSLNERVRTSALNGLGLVENADAAGVLVDLLARGDVGERRSAAILLVHQDMALAVPALIRALADADEFVRSNALEALKARSRGRDFGTDAGAWQAWWQSRPR